MPTANELYQQAKVAGNVSFQAEWGRTQQQLAKLSAGERVSQLGFSSLEPGEFVMAYDSLGQARMRIGHQSDGTVGVIYGNGTPPPVPSAPSVGARQLGVFVGWDGTFAAGYAKPGDFARVDVHMSEEQGFLPNGETIVGTIAAEGGILVGADSVTHYIKLVAVTSSDVASAPTAEVAVLPLPAGQIAAGAIGAQQLAVDIAMVTRLIVGNPSAARLELDGRIGVNPGMYLYDMSGSRTFSADATDGTVFMKGQLRTADNGERVVMRETPTSNDIRFYPATGTNYARLYARTFSVNSIDYGGLLMAGATQNSRVSFSWVLPDSVQMYRGIPGGSIAYSGFFAFDDNASIIYRDNPSTTSFNSTIRAASDEISLQRPNAYLRVKDLELRWLRAGGTDAEYGVWFDNLSFFFHHKLANSFRVQTKNFTWRMDFNSIKPYLWVQPNNVGLEFATTGIDVYNPNVGNYLAVGASAFVTQSSASTKTEIEELPWDPERVITGARSQMWEYRAEQRDDKGRYRKARKRVGPMADDLPPVLQVPTGRDPNVMGVDLATQLGVLWGASGQQTDRLDDLTARLAALEGAA